jgi:hypothetical protein
MQKPYGKSLANYIGPESCVISGNIGSEALTGVCADSVLSPEKTALKILCRYFAGAVIGTLFADEEESD